MTPFDVVKQRLQLGYHQNIFDSARSIISLEGIGALFRSYPTTLVMNLPYGCIMVAANESLRKILNPDGKYSLKTSMIAGSLAGAVASTLTTPLDVVKTRLQTQDLTSRSVYSTPTTTNAASSPMTNRAMSGFSFYPRFLVSMVPDTCDAINTHPSSRTAPRYTSFFQTVQIIFKEEGAAAFFKGAFPRLLVQAPSVAISWTAYEFVKSCLVDSKKE
jgi:solute carrier family 25 (mitochondrial iron transporter), member 28/37